MAIYKDGKKVFLLKDDHEVASISKNGTKVCGTKHENGLSPAYEQSVSDKAYPRATLYKVGGKSVKWNQMCALFDKAQWRTNATVANKDIINGEIIISGAATNSSYLYTTFNVIGGHKYLILTKGFYEGPTISASLPTFSTFISPQLAIDITKEDRVIERIWTPTTSGTDRAEIRFNAGGHDNNLIIHCSKFSIIDLTAIFGAGNEPTSVSDARIAELKAIAAAIPQYDAGSIKHAAVDIVRGDAPLIIPQAVRDLPDYGAGVGEVYNEIDMEPVVYHNMKAVDLGTLDWVYDAAYKRFYHSPFTEAKTPTSNSVAFNAVCSKYAARPATFDAGVYDGIGLTTNGILMIYDSKYTDAAAFKSSLSGVILHYEATTGGTDYAARLYRHKVGKRILDGSETWGLESEKKAYTKESRAKRYDFSPYYRGRIISTMQTADTKNVLSNEELSLYSVNTGAYPNQNWIYARLDSAQSALDYENYFQEHPATIYFELATEQVFDITPYFPAAPVVNVSAGGSVTFENEAKMPVPNKIQYIVQDV